MSARLTDYLSITQTSSELGITRVTLWRWVKDGKITPTTVMGRPAFTRKEVDALKKQNAKATGIEETRSKER